MRLLFLCFLVPSLSVAVGKTNAHKALTESLGQEVIEINGPVKELDEEPAAEMDDDEPTTITIQPATKNRKTTTIETRRRLKDEKPSSEKLDDEEARIAKELAEIYKDNADYKDEKAEETTITPSAATTQATTMNAAPRSGKPVERQRPDSFKFQPNDINNKEEVERFRTSVDDISCDKSNSNLADEEKPANACSAFTNVCIVVVLGIFALMYS